MIAEIIYESGFIDRFRCRRVKEPREAAIRWNAMKLTVTSDSGAVIYRETLREWPKMEDRQ
jgi:hypothetical protein